MAEETKVETTAVVAPEKQEAPKEVTPEVDLITRVSQIKPSQKKEEEGKFNINDLDAQIEKLPDPVLKEQVLGLKKSLLRGENQKYQEIAGLRKEYEQKLAEATTWTPERLQQELNKPDFVQAAQKVMQVQNPNSGLTDEQWSALSDSEKIEINQLKQKIASLEKNSWESVKSNQDAQLKQRYANYDPIAIDKLTEDLMRGKLQATREHLHKVLDYDDAVRRAYELGLSDKQVQNQEKLKAMSFDGGRSMNAPQGLVREKGETVEAFMRRSYQAHANKQ